jgi:pimeloyl-ACP methyl ester carboxylesterase
MGTLFALRWTAERPESVKSLFLTGATARFCAAEGYENGIESAKLREMARLLVKNKDGVMRAFFSSFLEESSAKPAILARLMRNVPGPEILLSGLAELDGMDLLEEIPSIKARVRIVQGSRDRITPVFGAEEIAARLPGAELSVVDGNHAVFLEQPGVLEQEWVKWTS